MNFLLGHMLSIPFTVGPIVKNWIEHAPQKIFKIRIFKLAENEFQITKFLDFYNSVTNSLTSRGLIQTSGFPGQWQPYFTDLIYLFITCSTKVV